MNLIKAIACAASILALTPVFAQEYGADESKIATVVYVSSSAGDDSNDGSMKSPLKTFAKIPKENARILLKKGDVFYEPLSERARNIPLYAASNSLKIRMRGRTWATEYGAST